MANPQLKDIECKQRLNRAELIQLLHQSLDALEGKHDLVCTINKERCIVPADAVINGKIDVEYEIDEGVFEFQVTLKWR